MRPRRRQPTRFPCPWDFPGKNTEVGCRFYLQCMKVKSKSEIAQSCSTLSDPMDCSLPGSSAHGIFHARVLEWVAIALSKSNLIAECYFYKLFRAIFKKNKSPPNPDLKYLLRLSITRQKLVRPVLLCLTCSKYKMIEQVSHQTCRMTYSLEYGAIWEWEE